MSDWSEQLAGARMQVDQQFQERVIDSRFSNQQWGLIMTAVEWEIHRPDDPEAARLVADTGNLPEIVPELDRIQEQIAGQARPVDGGAGDGGITGRVREFFGSLTGGAGGGKSDHDQQLQAAEALVDDYARELQAFLEKHNRWEDLRTAATAERPPE